MAVAFTVLADSRGACAEALELLCAALGLEPGIGPVRMVGTERWIARAAAKTAPNIQHRTATHTT